MHTLIFSRLSSSYALSCKTHRGHGIENTTLSASQPLPPVSGTCSLGLDKGGGRPLQSFLGGFNPALPLLGGCKPVQHTSLHLAYPFTSLPCSARLEGRQGWGLVGTVADVFTG